MTGPIQQRTDVLNVIASVVLDANGNAQVSVRPDVGQYWAPLVVRVSTRLKTTPVPQCTIYHGITGNTDQTAYIDDTAVGCNDTSSIIAGITVQFGEAITAVWVNGTPGDTAILIVNGVTLNQPPSVGQLPQVPGTHFSGHLSTETIVELSRAISGSPLVIPNNTSQIIPGNSFGLTFDMRTFASFSLLLNSVIATATAFDTLAITFFWYEKANGFNRMAQTTIEAFMPTFTGAFVFTPGMLFIQDVCRGPFLNIVFLNPSPDSQSISYALNGSTRAVTPFYRQTINDDATMFNASFVSTAPVAIAGGGTTKRIPFGLTNGRVWLKLTAVTFQLDFRFIFGSLGQYDLITVAANTTTRVEIILGKRALAIEVFNGNAGAASYSISGFDLTDKNE